MTRQPTSEEEGWIVQVRFPRGRRGSEDHLLTRIWGVAHLSRDPFQPGGVALYVGDS